MAKPGLVLLPCPVGEMPDVRGIEICAAEFLYGARLDQQVQRLPRVDAYFIATLQHVVKLMPSSPHAEVARTRLTQLSGQPTLTVDFKKEKKP